MGNQLPDIEEAQNYARKVVAGEIPAGKLLQLSCKRHLVDLQHAPSRGFEFDIGAATHIIKFFHFLYHSKGEWAGKEFFLEPWQKFLLAYTFGWINKATGLRRFRTSYNELPRKSGKSTMAAGVGLYMFFADGEPGAEVYAAATKKDQARIVHSEAIRMVRSSPKLMKRINIFRDNLHVTQTASKFEPLGADEDTLDGLNIHCAIIDEVHAHKKRGVYDVLDTATGARRQPLIFTITTAGFDRESICWDLHSHAERVLMGIVQDDTFAVFIASADEDDDWREEITWKKANPNFGISVKPDDLARKRDAAISMTSSQNTFRRLHLNQWTEQDVRWISMDVWDSITTPVNPDELLGLGCYAGIDLASTTDVAALSLVFPMLDGAVKILPFFWIPEENAIARSKRDRVMYDQWIRDGHIFATPGNVIDFDFIRKTVNELGEKYQILEIAIDRWNSTQLTTQLQGDGYMMVPVGQGYATMSSPSKKLEELLLSKRLHHGGHPVLRWMASNVTLEQDAAGNIKPSKGKSREKIDGIVSIVNALGRLIIKQDNSGSPYLERGIVTL